MSWLINRKTGLDVFGYRSPTLDVLASHVKHSQRQHGASCNMHALDSEEALRELNRAHDVDRFHTLRFLPRMNRKLCATTNYI